MKVNSLTVDGLKIHVSCLSRPKWPSASETVQPVNKAHLTLPAALMRFSDFS